MDTEAMATLKLMVSPTAAAQAVARSGPAAAAATAAALAKTQTQSKTRRKRNVEQRKTVRFSVDSKAETSDGEPSTG